MTTPLVVGITGASGAVYARRLLEFLVQAGIPIHLVISPSGATVWRQELGWDLPWQHFRPEALRLDVSAEQLALIRYHDYRDYMSSVASGSALTRGMVICPCSGGTLSAIVHGASGNLIARAADVHLKERRKLILVPRETPLSVIHLHNMKRAAEAGAVVLPAAPGWYHGVRSLQDLVDFIVARILDQLGIENRLMKRWGEDSSDVIGAPGASGASADRRDANNRAESGGHSVPEAADQASTRPGGD